MFFFLNNLISNMTPTYVGLIVCFIVCQFNKKQCNDALKYARHGFKRHLEIPMSYTPVLDNLMTLSFCYSFILMSSYQHNQ